MILSYSWLLEDMREMCLFIAEILKNCTAVGYSYSVGLKAIIVCSWLEMAI